MPTCQLDIHHHPTPPENREFRRAFVPHPIPVQLIEVAYSFPSSVLSLAHSICSWSYGSEHRQSTMLRCFILCLSQICSFVTICLLCGAVVKTRPRDVLTKAPTILFILKKKYSTLSSLTLWWLSSEDRSQPFKDGLKYKDRGKLPW